MGPIRAGRDPTAPVDWGCVRCPPEGSRMTFASLVHPHLNVIPRPRLDRYGKLAVGLLVVLGLGALAGGIALLAQPDGSVMHFDVAILEGSPFADFTIPGLILGGLFGL